jgi:hypothetical protein
MDAYGRRVLFVCEGMMPKQVGVHETGWRSPLQAWTARVAGPAAKRGSRRPPVCFMLLLPADHLHRWHCCCCCQVFERVASRTRKTAQPGGSRPRAVLFEGPPGGGGARGSCCMLHCNCLRTLLGGACQFPA